MKQTVIFLFLLFLSLPGFTQSDFRPGYIVTLQGDTLKGQVNYKGDIKNALECSFRANETAETKIYKPTELTSYGFMGGKFYEAKKAKIVNRQLNLGNQFYDVPMAGNDSVNFMQVLVKGKASLFLMRDATSATHFFLHMDKRPLEELIYLKATMVHPKHGSRFPYESKKYIGTLKIALTECPTIYNRIDKTDFKPTALQNLITDYNYCIDPAQQVQIQKLKKPVISWGVMGGISSSNLKIVVEASPGSSEHYLNGGTFKAKPAPTVGVFLDYTLPRSNEKLSINNSIFYTSRNYDSRYNFKDSDLAHSDYHVVYEFNYLRLETVLRYTMPAMKFAPFFQTGISNSLMLNHNEEISSTRYYLKYDPEDRQHDDYLTPIFRWHQLGWVAGIGIKHQLPNRKQLFLQTNYEFNTGFTRGVGVVTNSHNAGFLIGLGF